MRGRVPLESLPVKKTDFHFLEKRLFIFLWMGWGWRRRRRGPRQGRRKPSCLNWQVLVGEAWADRVSPSYFVQTFFVLPTSSSSLLLFSEEALGSDAIPIPMKRFKSNVYWLLKQLVVLLLLLRQLLLLLLLWLLLVFLLHLVLIYRRFLPLLFR